MSDDQIGPIAERSGEIPPISPARRRAKIAAAWVFALIIVVFLAIFIATYSQSERSDAGIFGSAPSDSAVGPLG